MKKIIKEKCDCRWGLPMSNALLYKPQYYPKIILEMIKIFLRVIANIRIRILRV